MVAKYAKKHEKVGARRAGRLARGRGGGGGGERGSVWQGQWTLCCVHRNALRERGAPAVAEENAGPFDRENGPTAVFIEMHCASAVLSGLM